MQTFTSLREAARYAGITGPGIRKWIDEYGIGEQQPDGRWHISQERLDELLSARARVDQLRIGPR